MATNDLRTTDVQLTGRDISNLASADATAAFLNSLGYDTGGRTRLTAEAIGLSGESAAPIRSIELMSEDQEGFLRVMLVQLRSLTAKSRNDLARVLGKTNVDHLIILTSNFDTLEFVLLDKRKRESRGPGGQTRVQVVPLALAFQRKAPATKELRTIRRFTWTCRDGLEQYDKLRSVFEAAAFTEEYFCNRALFADHFLLSRLREDKAWQDNPAQAFLQVKSLLQDARHRWLEKGEQIVRDQLYEPLFELLGFKAKVVKGAKDARTKPDYLLLAKSGDGKTAAFVYAWDRWLDGPDFNIDQHTPEENPGACVVSALEEGIADWIIVTNGRQWRLYSRHAHSRATNFYEVDLLEALVASGDMGSGHFLVEAVDFITDRMLTFLNQFPVNPVTFMLERTRRNILAALGQQGVSVDPDKLTEVNLLKRHVLKRCIYGVDLNPMAVELAKVSLWLDAFTIGAPLSFLDHHIRCGNSLIGATFKDLEAATTGQLFGIDYEPLLRAIRHVLQVNRMADATAAEVKQSASEYDHAREELSGYQIVLDLLVAKYFGYPKAPGLLELGNELDLSSRRRFLESLSAVDVTKKGEKPATEVVGEVSTLAQRLDLRFFHWEVEFPEVFFGFEDTNQRRLKHKNKIAEGSAGFDAVVSSGWLPNYRSG